MVFTYDKKVIGTKLIYGNASTSPKSSLTIRGGSLRPNQTYQLMVQIENRQNPFIEARGYLLVDVKLHDVPIITIG